MRTIGPVLRLAVLALVAVVFAAAVIITYGRVRFQDTTPYTAEFTDVSGLRPDDDVRVAGVTVGKVRDVTVAENGVAQVAFTVQSRTPLMSGSTGTIRYKNLVGQRYLEIGEGTGAPTPLGADGVIPVDRTTPALDLDQLYNGFAPLFEGLQPEQVNELSSSLIGVLQGEGGAVTNLLDQVGSLTSTLADRDRVIGDLITNLNTVLGTVNAKRGQVTTLVDQLQQLVSGLAVDRQPLGDAITKFDRVTGTVDRLLADARPDVQADVAQIRTLASTINADQAAVDDLLKKVPGYYVNLNRVGGYQSSFQFYLCGVQVRLELPGLPAVMSDTVASQEERCQF
ncbi:MCE family protein [Pseudonocardia sp. NPDC049154]|uniref:MCE family protein n=1 Tax=Pseudonocardia sp. NPDC049154 TaxID=3155501 RepID=UPI00340AA47A